MRLAPLLALVVVAPAFAQTSATYAVSFEATWSADTHPLGFPSDPHFSPLVGATHTDAVALWAVGEEASPGVEAMAETGATSELVAEAEAGIASGGVEASILGGAIGTSPGSTSLQFTASESHAYVTLVSMLAPSPDWFVGVDGLALRDADGWRSEIVVDLHVYDAGTDSGSGYTSEDRDTDPADPIAEIGAAPFADASGAIPVGTFTFTLQTVTAGEDGPGGLAVSSPAPNPVRDTASLTVTTSQAGPVRVEVVDVLGRVVSSPDVPSGPGRHEIRLDAARWAPGLYHVRISSAGERTTRRLVVLR